jgi:glycosyltransferase involved in cell wall biosynthesis
MFKVSVVIPSYNYARFISDAIQSVLTQSFRDFETIVIDDGSRDNTAEVVSAFPVKYFYQENQGLPAARNRGIALTHSEYIIFLDADDILTENALQRSVEILDKHPEVAFSYGQAQVVDETGTTHGLIKSSFLNGSSVVEGKEQIKELALYSNRIPISTVMVRRSCLDKVGGFHEEMKRFQDHQFFIKLAKRFPVAYIAEPLVKYRVHPGSLHKNVDPRLAERVFLQIVQEIFDDRELASYLQPWRNQVWSHYYQKIAGYAHGGQDMKLARHYMRRAVKVYPRLIFSSNCISLVYLYAKSFLPRRLWLTLRTLKRRFIAPKRPMEGKTCLE